jgi:hypothetical protein
LKDPILSFRKFTIFVILYGAYVVYVDNLAIIILSIATLVLFIVSVGMILIFIALQIGINVNDIKDNIVT